MITDIFILVHDALIEQESFLQGEAQLDMQLTSRFQLLSKGGQFEGNMNPVSYMGEDTKTSTISAPSLDLIWCVSFVTNLVTMPRNTIKIENILLKHHKPIIPNHMVDPTLKTSRSTPGILLYHL